MKKPFFTSPVFTYLLNRPLRPVEKQNHLPQKERSPEPPWFQLSVIKMNSTFLECPDGAFPIKGFVALFGLIAMGVSGLMLFSAFSTVLDWPDIQDDKFRDAMLFAFFAFFLGVILSWINIYFLKKEMFRYTHYPMRFNRKTRKVYCFRDDGTIMTEDWEKLFFCIWPMRHNWGVYMHCLAEDGEIVLESFSLPHVAEKDDDLLTSQWEFVRRYMEEPDELPRLVGQVPVIMDIADRRETFWNGFHRFMANFGSFLPLLIIFSPLGFIFAISRWIAMQSCIVPVWPEEIEKECQIDPNDPYIRDRDHLADPNTVQLPEGCIGSRPRSRG